MPKQTKSSNNAALKGFALTLVILILAVCVMAAMTEGFSNWNPYGWFDKPAEEQQTPEGDDPAPEQPTEDGTLATTIHNTEHVKLSISAMTAAESNSVTKMITAEVRPATASNQQVDWEIKWADESTEAISDYLILTPTADGALTATIECIKAFRGKEAVVTVTTREGGFTAACYVSYAGEPSAISVNNGVSGNCNLGGEASFSISLSNIFNDVGSEYYDDITITNVSVGGTCSTANKWVTVAGRNKGTIAYAEIKTDVQISELIISEETNFKDAIEASIVEGSLQIITPSASDVYSTFSPADVSPQEVYYDAFYGDWDGYVDITVECGDLSATVRINLILGVDGVSLSQSSIVF